MTEKQSNLRAIKSNKNPADTEENNISFKPSLGSKEEKLIQYLEDGECPPLMPNIGAHQWDIWFYSNDPLRPTRILKKNNESRTVCEYGKEALHGEVYEAFRRFARMDDHPSGKYCLSDKEVASLSRKLMYSGRRVEAWPKPIGFKSDEGDCFQRFDFDPAASASLEDFPTIALNLKHMTNSRNFCERVGSLYDEKANRKQILFLIGDGDGGKSALIELLTFLAGGDRGVASINMGVYKDHGFDPLLDKRVWIAEELSTRFFEHEQFKVLTGGSAVQINRKNEKQFNAYLTGMLFATSNKTPKIDDDSGLRNRILICEVDPIPKELRLPPEETKARMRAELPYFIRYCLEAYSSVSGDGTLLPDTTDKLEAIIADKELDCEAIFDTYFYEDHTTNTKRTAKLTSVEYLAVWEDISENYKAFAKTTSKHQFDDYVKKRLVRKSLSELVSRNGVKYRVIPGLAKKGR